MHSTEVSTLLFVYPLKLSGHPRRDIPSRPACIRRPSESNHRPRHILLYGIWSQQLKNPRFRKQCARPWSKMRDKQPHAPVLVLFEKLVERLNGTVCPVRLRLSYERTKDVRSIAGLDVGHVENKRRRLLPARLLGGMTWTRTVQFKPP